LLRDHADACEADLQRFYGIDYRDRWRGTLTLRRLAVLIRHLPPESATARALAGGPVWTLTEHLLDDVRRQVAVLAGAKEPDAYPGRFTVLPSPRDTLARNRALADARRRARARRDRIAAGEIT